MKCFSRSKLNSAVMVLCGLSFLAFQGCATIMTGGTGNANIQSTPPGARFSIFRNGLEVHSGKTPQMVELKKRGKYSIKIEMDGYEPLDMPIKKGISGWYAFGNLVFGGLVGYLIVDPLSGAMFTFPEKRTNYVLSKKMSQAPELAPKEGLVMLMLQDIPKAQRSSLVPLGVIK